MRPVDDVLARVNHYAIRARQEWQRRAYETHIARAIREQSQLFGVGASLPSGYGKGMTERAVEFGWAAAKIDGGRMLDAGSTFNHAFTIDAILPKVASLTVFNQAPEPLNFGERGVAYDYGDLRSMPYAAGTFDVIASLSVLEHVGMDNTGYGARDDRSGSADAAVDAALDEMVRVLRPGGTIAISVPYGLSEDHGWLRTFDAAAIARVGARLQGFAVSTTVYQRGDDGWQVSSLSAASSCVYDPGGWAQAVACVAARSQVAR